ncbi:MAG: glycerophosphodiester phosphodiesterase [Micropruina sp.]|uniref:glycerophosphodiester phosphodiesterase n=1 Tax=Micropruina sp. TaxID=2737536 RepID=UPI0039E64036
MSPLSRRDLLIGGGSAVVGAGIAGTVATVYANRPATPATPSPDAAGITVRNWIDRRQAPYFIGHRGAEGVLPEHTLPGYQKALEWGAECLEISVVRSSDGILYCLQDLTLERTTTLKGEARSLTSAELDLGRVTIPRLGPRWQGVNMPAIPRLTDVLKEVGGKAVLCIEPRDDAAYQPLIELIEQQQLKDSVILRFDHLSPRIAAAKTAGYPVAAYLTSAEVATEAAIKSLAGRLDPRQDVLVLPARNDTDLLPQKLVQAAVRSGVPVWVSPVHRRHEVDYFSLVGVQGMVAACNGYTARTVPAVATDDWASGQLAPGALTRNPDSSTYSLQWPDVGVIEIPTPGRQAFMTLGQFAPITATSYRIAFDVAFDPMPSDTWQHVSIAFGHDDDRYYEHRLGNADGYHALLRADGTMGLATHVEGDRNGRQLVGPASSRPMKRGVWARMTLDVTPDEIRWARDDGTVLSVKDSRFRGGYFHIGSSATDGALKLRGLAVS